LVRINTPRAVQTESRKAFRKLPNLEAAITTLCGLKGVGTTLASAVLAAMAPELAPFMADECLLSMPEVEGIDYTMKEYIKLVEKTKECVERLNAQGGDWTPHKVELTVWSFFVLRENKPQVLDDLPSAEAEVVRPARENGLHQEVSNADLQAEAGEESVASEPASNGSPEPETCTGQQPLETPGAESPAQQTETPVVETPVESHNGNGHTEHLEEKEEAAAPEAAQTKRTLEDPEPAAAAPESKRPCTESVEREEREETEPAQPPPAAPAAPNGVNSTQPQPISSGGD